MYDIIMILLFWAMVLSPCMVALNVGIERYTEADIPDDFMAERKEFETTPRHPGS